jgi:hypothetical protein
MFLLYIITPLDDVNQAVRFIADLTLENDIKGNGNFFNYFLRHDKMLSDVFKVLLNLILKLKLPIKQAFTQ